MLLQEKLLVPWKYTDVGLPLQSNGLQVERNTISAILHAQLQIRREDSGSSKLFRLVCKKGKKMLEHQYLLLKAPLREKTNAPASVPTAENLIVMFDRVKGIWYDVV
ncbi:hypothetical protein TIFTF001_035422 [Ficus carica]|uniref:Uncharacterized protein n=1 Tax=Ficus carica TaxID=3494 RepID=A0AA88JBQ3_FICCA|nr:hypothetical protein TIFTF001_035422 [Ficus carica]